jgi:cytochrome c biogenesis protein CcmG/thiol:disulfide interchange protein DsbE
MRRFLIPLAGVALVVLLVIGLSQAGSKDHASGDEIKPLSRAEVSRPLPGAPTELAALRRRVNVLEGGGKPALERQLRALRGHPVVVNLWASWCGPCRFELPFFQRQANLRGTKVAFVGVNVGDNHGDAADFARRYPMPYPSIEDPRQSVLNDYGAKGLPSTAFYDAKGEMVFLHQGLFPTEAKLAEAIERYAPA